MAIPSQSYVFVTGAVPTATQWNSNFVTFVAAFSNIDYTNIGAAGIYASQIKPTSASAATFGGSQTYTFPAGIALSGSISGITSFTSTGALSFNGGIGGLGGTWTTNALQVGLEVSATQTGGGFISNAGNSAQLLVWDNSGNLQIHGGTTPTWVPPAYTNAGAATASTEHIVRGTVVVGTVTSSSSVTNTVTFSGAAAFTGSTSFFVTATVSAITGTINGYINVVAIPFSATSFTYTVYNGCTGSIVVSLSYIASGS